MNTLENKKIRFLSASVVLFVLLLYSFTAPANIRLQITVFATLVLSIISILALFFSYKQKSFLISLILPILFGFSSFMVSFFFQNLSLLFIITFSLYSSVLYYVSLLALNIFLVSDERQNAIPLVRPAKTFLTLVTLHSLFLFITVVYKLPFPFYVQSLLALISIYLVALEYWWLVRIRISYALDNLEKRRRAFVSNTAFVISFLSSQVFVSLCFLPIEDFFRSLFVITTFYITSSLMESFESNLFKKKQIVEYIMLSFVLIFLVMAA